MPPILFPTSTAPGNKAQEGGGRLVNAYAERLGQGAKAQAVVRRGPGLRKFTDIAGQETPLELSGFRGAMLAGNDLFVAFEDTLVVIASTGVVTEVDELPGDGPVYFARNNKTPTPDYTVTTEDAVYTFTATPGSVAELSDGDLPQPSTATEGDGYIFFGIADGRVFSTGLNAVTISSIDETIAEGRPDNNVRVLWWDGQLLVFGRNTLEFYRNTANATGFPLTRVGSPIFRGLIGPRAIAGFEDGFGKALIWVGDDNAVHKLAGMQPVQISPPDLDRLIAAVADKSALEASSFIVGGHACWVLSCADWTWIYDLNSDGWWHERNSFRGTRWRATGGIYAFGKWLCGDTETGDLLELTEEVQFELTDPIPTRVESIQMEAFPANLRISNVQFDFVMGVGVANGLDPIERDPRVSISWSDDGGVLWSTPLIRSIGRQGEAKNRVRINRGGLTGPKGRRWRIEYTDGGYFGLLGGSMDVEARGN